MQQTDITCGQLMLRPWSASDEQAYLAGRNDPDVLRWTGTPSPYRLEDARAFLLEQAPAGWETGTAATWGVFDATTAQLLGGASLHAIAGGGANVSYWCTPAARGRGVATEVIRAICRWGFGFLELERIGWECCVGNWASRAVAQKCGFTVEGVARKAFNQRGTRVDDWRGSLLSTDPAEDTRPLPTAPTLSDGVVTLRPWSLSDAPDVARACSDPLTVRWLPVPSPYTLEDAVGYLDGYVFGSWADGTAAELAVTDAVTGELLGAMGLKLHNRRLGFGEIGYWTAPWARGRGVAGRGAALSTQWGLDVLELNRVELLADVENLPSQRAAEKAGFLREGIARRARTVRSEPPRDMVVFSRVISD